jgi:tetratricopeptide (TPR) repeat protein
MTKLRVALPAVLTVLVSIPLAAQQSSFTDESIAGSLPLARIAQQTPALQDPSAFVVKPQLTDEQLADLYMVRKDYAQAAQIYKRLADQQPHNCVYLNKLGIAFHQQTALTVALKYYEKAVKADPLYADAQNNIGTIWYQRKKYGKAVRAYERAIKIRSDMAVLYSNLGYAYFGEKKYEQSIAAFRQALAIDPKLFESYGSRAGSVLQDRSVGDRGRFYFLLAKSYAEAGNIERCLLYLRKAKEEGYGSMTDVKKDPAFSAVLKEPAVQELLAPKPAEVSRP